MIRALIFAFIVTVSYAVTYSGRFTLPIKRGSTLDRVYGRINIAGHIVTVVVAMVLPLLTNFVGLPFIAYLAASLIACSLLLYRLRPISLRVRFFPAEGKRAKPLAEQERTRWPYAWTCGIGYLAMVAYVGAIAPVYW